MNTDPINTTVVVKCYSSRERIESQVVILRIETQLWFMNFS